MTEVVYGLVGVVVGVLLGHWLQVRADRVSWARRARQELYASAIRQMQTIEDVARDALVSIGTAAHLIERREKAGEDTQPVHNEFDEEIRQKRATLRAEVMALDRLRPEFDMVATELTNHRFLMCVLTAKAAHHSQQLEDDWREEHGKLEEYVGDLRGLRDEFVERARREFNAPDEPGDRLTLARLRVRRWARETKSRLRGKSDG